MTASVCLQTPRHKQSSSPRLRARVVPIKTLFENRGRREGRVLVAPMVRVQQKKHAAEPQVRTGHPALPARWLYGLLRALPGDRRSCPRHERASSAPAWPQRREARTTRLHRAHQDVRPRGQATLHPDTPTATHLTLVTIAIAPLWRGGMGEM
ncbi:hypothetical protein BRAO285_1580045 [Bradyrhizobium sp. ORS 285]|nr:hypothetical protein BRAO285_1580045 [Bradyrhizobium sp. ORS 285]